MGAHADPQRSHPDEVDFSALLAFCAALEAGEVCQNLAEVFTLKKTHPEGRMLYCAGLQESLHLT